MHSAFIEYMRAHGNTPSRTQYPMSAGAISGLLASAPAILLFRRTGSLVSLAHSLNLGMWPTIVAQVLLLVIAGALYGRIFNRAAKDPRGGWLFGISYGFLIWMLGPITLLQWFREEPIAVGEPAIGLYAGHVIYGLALGLLFPWIHNLLQKRLADGKTRLESTVVEHRARLF